MTHLAQDWRGGWLAILFAAAWLLPTAAATQPSQGPYLTTDQVQVRKGPGAQFDVVAVIPKGIKIHVVGSEGSWLRVQSKHGNPPGYIDDRYARPLESPASSQSASSVSGPYTTTAEVHLREGPGLHYRVLTTIPKGIKINVVGAEGNWLKVQSKHGKPSGYLDKRYAEREPNR